MPLNGEFYEVLCMSALFLIFRLVSGRLSPLHSEITRMDQKRITEFSWGLCNVERVVECQRSLVK